MLQISKTTMEHLSSAKLRSFRMRAAGYLRTVSPAASSMGGIELEQYVDKASAECRKNGFVSERAVVFFAEMGLRMNPTNWTKPPVTAILENRNGEEMDRLERLVKVLESL